MMLNIGCGGESIGDVRLDFTSEGTTANVVADCQKLPFDNNVFDEVYERNVFEHLPNPAQHLFEVKRILKQNGKLTLTTDNAGCLKYYLLGTHTGGYRKHDGKDVHFALFTMEHLRNFMAYCGFRIVELRLVDTEYFTRWFDRFVRLFVPTLSYPRILVIGEKA